MQIPFKLFSHGRGLKQPFYATPGSAGCDIEAAVSKDTDLRPGVPTLIPTGFALAVPSGYEVQLRSRSGLSLKQRIVVYNSPATIDSDYRGEIQVILMNHGSSVFVVERGMRIAQMVIAPVTQASFKIVSTLEITDRAEKGFGSSGW